MNVEDVEMVYPGVVYDGFGRVKSSPIHTLIPEAFPSKAEWMSCSKFIPSGLRGSISLFLSPNTARTPTKRKQPQTSPNKAHQIKTKAQVLRSGTPPQRGVETQCEPKSPDCQTWPPPPKWDSPMDRREWYKWIEAGNL